MSDQPQVIRREDYTAPAFLVEKVELVFELDRDVTNVKSRLFVHANPVRGTGGGDMVHLDGEDMKLVSIAVDDRKLGVSINRGLALPRRATLLLLISKPRSRPSPIRGLKGFMYRKARFARSARRRDSGALPISRIARM